MTTVTTASDLLLGLAARGVTVEAAGDRLRFHPRAAVTVDDMAVLREHKGAILRLLADGVFQHGYTGYGCETAQNTGNTGVLLPLVPQDSPGDNYEFEERAAIHEFDAGLPRVEAERLALVAGGAGDGDHGDAAPVIESPTLPGDIGPVIESQDLICPRCGGVRIGQGVRWRWCIDCEVRIDLVDDPQDLPGADAADTFEVIDFPDPCAVCGGIVRWQDLRGGWHCEACSPRTIGPRLRELAQRLRVRYGLPGGRIGPASFFSCRIVTDRTTGRTWPDSDAGGPGPRAVPDGILADPPTACGDCGRPVIGGQPGQPAGLCYGCWQRRIVGAGPTNTPAEKE